MKGIDTSHHQGDRGLIDWKKVKLAGIEFAILKCTQGTSFLDSMYKRDKEEVRKIGIPLGYYHFAGKMNEGGQIIPQDPVKESMWFTSNIGGMKEGEFMVLDWEVQHKDPVGWCQDFWRGIDQIPWMYMNESTFLKYNWPKDWNYWIAKYPKEDNGTMKTPPQGNWKIWQYSSKGSIPGIIGNVDLNYSANLTDAPVVIKEFKPGKFIYLSQRDKEWGDDKIGNTPYLIKNLGCTITCISMASAWFNNYREPDWMARNLEFTPDAKVYWKSIDKVLDFKFEWRFYNFQKDRITEAIANPKKVCLFEIKKRHWVVALRKSIVPGSTWYKVADPWTGAVNWVQIADISGGAVLTIK
jgi:GH25 family lysozyme M1 (1,4-beta-N-acetylmuramidase)